MKTKSESVEISIIVPSYNEEETLDIFHRETEKVFDEKMPGVSHDYFFIDDGSKDDTMGVIRKLHEEDDKVHFVSFSRNFGKEAAIYAGLTYSDGKYTVIMDADMQDPPAVLPDMYRILNEGEAEEDFDANAKASEKKLSKRAKKKIAREEELKGKSSGIHKDGRIYYDCVGSRRVSRVGEPPIRSFFARRFYHLMAGISKTEIVDGVRDFQMMNRKVVNAILSMGEYNRFSKGIFGWVGFRKKWLEYENVERVAGETKWSFWSLFWYALDGITAFSTQPLLVSSFLGVIFCICAFIMIIVIIIKTLVFGDPTSGWPSMVCIILLLSGVQLLSIGILGQYLSKTYLETKKRPIFLVEESDVDED